MAAATNFKRIGHFRETRDLADHLASLDLHLPLDPKPLSAAEGSPLAQPLQIGGRTVGNRWVIQPMEGWDGTDDGRPTEHVRRRWRHFGLSGAKLIWGGEAFAVCREGRANPNQLYFRPENVEPMGQLLATLRQAHADRFGTTEDLLVGLQLTHSGRFCRPDRKDRLEPRIAYRHPVLDRRFAIAPDDPGRLLSDEDVRRIIDDYITCARMARDLGFDFVDVKHCHGYLGHEFLSAYDRPGPFGGSLENRSRFLREIARGIARDCPDLLIAVRLSLFDFPPFRPDPKLTGGGNFGPGIPEDHPAADYPAFGCRRDNPTKIDLDEPVRLLRMMRDEMGVALVNLSAGSPYYNPHIQRPAFFPPSDGYQPPEDPLVGCQRQLDAARRVREQVRGLPVVGSAFSYFQDFLPQVAQAVVREGWVDMVGLGRMVLSYPDLPADVLAGKPPKTKKICRTFSDCTTAPRSGIVSGCFPLDDYYKKSPAGEALKEAKQALRVRLTQSDLEP